MLKFLILYDASEHLYVMYVCMYVVERRDSGRPRTEPGPALLHIAPGPRRKIRAKPAQRHRSGLHIYIHLHTYIYIHTYIFF